MQRFVSICLLLALAAIAVCHTVQAQSYPSELYYFNPDAPQSNLSRLKRGMDDLLTQVESPITFQPFAHLLDFENQLKKKRPAFLFVPEWYFKKYGARLNLRPFLVPIRKGATTYRKVLLGRARTDLTITKLANPTMAMTSMGPDGDAIVNMILGSSRGVASGKINPIIVSKDSDALFALALGQVDMALVVKENIDLIAQINPNILHSVRPLLESTPIPMPVLCFTESVAPAKAIQELKALFLSSKIKRERLIVMEMLQINEWKAIKN